MATRSDGRLHRGLRIAQHMVTRSLSGGRGRRSGGMACIACTSFVMHSLTSSVNPVCSTGPAVFVDGWALSHLWLFWIAPILGGVLAGLTYSSSTAEPERRWVDHEKLPDVPAASASQDADRDTGAEQASAMALPRRSSVLGSNGTENRVKGSAISVAGIIGSAKRAQCTASHRLREGEGIPAEQVNVAPGER